MNVDIVTSIHINTSTLKRRDRGVTAWILYTLKTTPKPTNQPTKPLAHLCLFASFSAPNTPPPPPLLFCLFHTKSHLFHAFCFLTFFFILSSPLFTFLERALRVTCKGEGERRIKTTKQHNTTDDTSL